MTEDHRHSRGPHEVTRRGFLKLVAAGILAGCSPPQQPTPMATPTETLVPTPTTDVRRPEIIEMRPEVPSKVVRASHGGVWGGEKLVPAAIRQMLDGSITELTGLNDAREAWAALFAPDERIAIKVNTIMGSSGWTHVPLVMAVTERLQAVGVPPEQTVIFDRDSYELHNAGFPLNEDGAGVRCYGTNGNYVGGWILDGLNIRLSDVLLGCDALINIPILKQHVYAGVSFAMKNHYGTFNRPEAFHRGELIRRGLAGLNTLPPIRDRTRLIIGDALQVVLGDDWDSSVAGDSILMGFDPVAHDTVGLQMFGDVLTARDHNPESYVARADGWLANGKEFGLGTNDLDTIDLVEIELG